MHAFLGSSRRDPKSPLPSPGSRATLYELGLHAVRISAGQFSAYIEEPAVFAALKQAVKQAQQTVTEKYLKAIHGLHKDAVFRQVLLARGWAAATSHDALGYFNPSAVAEPLRHILNKPVQIATFNSHLSDGQDEEGGRS